MYQNKNEHLYNWNNYNLRKQLYRLINESISNFHPMYNSEVITYFKSDETIEIKAKIK